MLLEMAVAGVPAVNTCDDNERTKYKQKKMTERVSILRWIAIAIDLSIYARLRRRQPVLELRNTQNAFLTFRD